MSYTSPIQIDSQFVDIDFDQAAKDCGRMMGMIPTPALMSAQLEADLDCYGDSMPVYSRDQWPAMIATRDAEKSWLSMRITDPYDQNGEPSCVYNSLGLCHQLVWNSIFGDDKAIKLSAISGYRWNGSPSSGSSVGGSIKWLLETGLLPADTPANRALLSAGKIKAVHPNNGYRAPFAEGWKDTAKLFRADKWMRITTVEEWVSAILNGHPCSGGRDSHCICHCRLAMDGGKLLSIYCNSWGSWGSTMDTAAGPLKSFGFDSEAKIRTMVSRDAFALVSVVRPAFMRAA